MRNYALFLIFLGLSTLSTSAQTLILCGVVYIGPVDFDTQGGILFFAVEGMVKTMPVSCGYATGIYAPA